MIKERLIPDAELTIANTPGQCMECGETTLLAWMELSFCSLDCLDDFVRGFNEDMKAGYEGVETEMDRRLKDAPDVPVWWPTYIYELVCN